MKFTEMKAIKKKFNLLNLFGWMEWKWIELFAAPSLKEKKTFLLNNGLLVMFDCPGKLNFTSSSIHPFFISLIIKQIISKNY